MLDLESNSGPSPMKTRAKAAVKENRVKQKEKHVSICIVVLTFESLRLIVDQHCLPAYTSRLMSLIPRCMMSVCRLSAVGGYLKMTIYSRPFRDHQYV